MDIKISDMKMSEFVAALPIVKQVVQSGDTYALPKDMSAASMKDYFFRDGNRVFKAEIDGQMVGLFYSRPNQSGGGAHVANAGFMVAESARKKGVASAMVDYALLIAKRLGFEAMQFNFVVSANAPAVNLWKKKGFSIVGTIPKAFDHPALGKVDALVMHKFL